MIEPLPTMVPTAPAEQVPGATGEFTVFADLMLSIAYDSLEEAELGQSTDGEVAPDDEQSDAVPAAPVVIGRPLVVDLEPAQIEQPVLPTTEVPDESAVDGDSGPAPTVSVPRMDLAVPTADERPHLAPKETPGALPTTDPVVPVEEPAELPVAPTPEQEVRPADTDRLLARTAAVADRPVPKPIPTPVEQPIADPADAPRPIDTPQPPTPGDRPVVAPIRPDGPPAAPSAPTRPTPPDQGEKVATPPVRRPAPVEQGEARPSADPKPAAESGGDVVKTDFGEQVRPQRTRTPSPVRLAERIESWVRRSENMPPPRVMTLRGPEMEGLMIRVAMQSDGLSIVIHNSTSDDAGWIRRLGDQLTERGFDVAELAEQDDEQGERRPVWDEDTARHRRRARFQMPFDTEQGDAA